MRAANGRLPSRAPYDRLDGANRRQMPISAIVEITTVTNSLDKREMEDPLPPRAVRCSICRWSTFIRPSGLHSGRHCGNLLPMRRCRELRSVRRRAHAGLSVGPTRVGQAISSVTLTASAGFLPAPALQAHRPAGSCASGSATDRFRSVEESDGGQARRLATRCSRAP